MLLSDFLNDLYHGELNQLSVANPVDDLMDAGATMDLLNLSDDSYPSLISHINIGLNAIYTKLDVRTDEILIQLQEERTIYPLTEEHATSNTASLSDKFIIDSISSPFKSNIIRVDSVFDETGKQLPVNDASKPDSVYLPAHNKLQVTEPVEGAIISVLYKAGHPKLYDTDPAATTVLDIPDYFVEVLASYVASRMYSRGSSQIHQNLSVSYMNKYNMLCKNLERQNVLHTSPNETSTRFERSGWV